MADTDTKDPVVKISEMMVELGSSTVGNVGSIFGSKFTDGGEYNPKLQGADGAKIFDQMRREDAQVKSSLRVQTMPLQGADWDVQASDPAVEADLRENLFTRLDFQKFLRHYLLCLPFGFSLMEKVMEVDRGKLWWKKLAHRAAPTITEWNLDDFGELETITQQVTKKDVLTDIKIPAVKLFHAALDMEGSNYQGISVLRPVYKNWFIKDKVERVDGMRAERFGMGVPYVEAPKETTDKDDKQAVTVLKSFRAGAKAYLVIPFGWKMGIMGADGNINLDLIPTLRYHGESIFANALANFLYLGTTATGSRALGDTFLDMFINALFGLAEQIIADVNRQLIQPFLLMNYANAAGIEASLTCSNLQVRGLESIAKSLSLLSSAGFVTPDQPTEQIVRRWLQFPPVEEPDATGEGNNDPGRDAPSDPDDDVPDPENPEPTRASRRRSHRHAPAAQTRLAKTWWRDLRPEEEFVSLAEIEGRHEDGIARIQGIFKKLKPTWVQQLSDTAVEVLEDGDISDIDGITVPKALRYAQSKAIIAVLRETYDYGRRTVREERSRQYSAADLNWSDPDAMIFRDEPQDTKEVFDHFSFRARKYLDRLSLRMEAVAQEYAVNLHRTHGKALPPDPMEDLEDTLLDQFDPTALRTARPLISEAIAMGRDKATEKLREEIAYATFSAILDENTCDRCQENDGEVYQVGTEEYYADAPPYKNCESNEGGENLCRCLFIYTFKTQTRAAA